MATITTLENGITGLSFRTSVNNNFANLNADKAETTTVSTLASTVSTNTTDIATNTADISTLDTRVTQTETDITALQANPLSIGFADYNDVTTQTTPITVPGTNTYVYLTNDGAGSYSTNQLQAGVTDVWDTINNSFDWSELSVGDMIDIRLDCTVTTTAPSQSIQIDLELGDSFKYNILFTETSFKAAGTHNINRFNGIYIGSEDTRTGGGRFKIKSDDDATIKVNGWYVKVIKNG